MNQKSLFSNQVKLLLGALVITAFALNCGKPAQQSKAPDASGRKMLVVLAAGDAQVTRGQNTMPAKVGLVVQQGDLINTGSGTMDLQTRDGSAIRLKPDTSMEVTALTEGATEQTTMSLKKGGLLAQVDRQAKGSEYKVVTPTAIAGVRGTSYSISVDESGNNPTVRVLDGSVALSPRIESLEKYSQSEIENDPALAKLASVQSQEVVLDQSTEGKLDSSLERKLKTANKAINGKGDLKAISQDVSATTATGLKSEKTVITQEEKADNATLIVVDPSTFDSALENALSGNGDAAADLLANARDEKASSVLEDLQSAAAERNLNSAGEISAYYQKTYTVRTNDGKTYSGALMARDAGMVVLHTEKGIVKLEQSQVQSMR